MEATCKQQQIATLVKEHITGHDDPGAYLETLDDLFDAWIGTPDEVCYNREYRLTVLSHYRSLQAFMKDLQRLGVITPQGNNS